MSGAIVFGSLLAVSLNSALIVKGPKGRLVVVGPAAFVEAEEFASSPRAEESRCYGGAFVCAEGRYPVLARFRVPRDLRHLWLRFRGEGVALVALRPRRKLIRWLWPRLKGFDWFYAGEIPADVEDVALQGTERPRKGAGLDCVLWTRRWGQAPLELPSEACVVVPNWSRTGEEISPYLASANVASPVATFVKTSKDWLDAFKTLGIKFLRFQGVGRGWDYRDRSTWTLDKLADFKEAVRRARRAGVEKFMFCVCGLNLPLTKDGKLIEEDFPRYAEACARLVEEFSSGELFVEYWEPFNELDHPAFIRRIKEHGQDFKVVVRLYSACARAMKRANPRIKVGGPASCWPSGWAARELVTLAEAPVDFVSWHHYATGKGLASDEEILRAVAPEGAFWQGVKRMEEASRAGRERPELLITEFHINFEPWIALDKRLAGPIGAVFVASLLSWLPQTFVKAAMIHDVRSVHYGLVGIAREDFVAHSLGLFPLGMGREDTFVRPVGWVYRWFNEFVKGRLVSVDVLDETEGLRILAFAWRDGESKGVMIVNPRKRPTEVALVWGESGGAQGRLRFCLVGPTGPVEGTIGQQAGVVRLFLPQVSVGFVVNHR